MKKVFILSWFYIIGSIILIISPVVLFVFLIIYDNETLMPEIKVPLYVFCFLATVFFLIISGICFIQWVQISERGIVAKNLFGTIRKVSWDKILYVEIVPIAYSTVDVQRDWFVFIDSENGELNVQSPFNFKGRYIKIKASAKNRFFLEKCKADIDFKTRDDF